LCSRGGAKRRLRARLKAVKEKRGFEAAIRVARTMAK
jgi:hypothetical protein